MHKPFSITELKIADKHTVLRLFGHGVSSASSAISVLASVRVGTAAVSVHSPYHSFLNNYLNIL